MIPNPAGRRRRSVVASILTAAALAVVLAGNSPRPARAVGVYEDAVGEVDFLTGPQSASITARFVRTNGPDVDASLFILAGAVSVRPYLLVQLEQPYVSLSDPSDIATAFGDLRLRVRARLTGGGGRALSALGAFRTGSGSTRVYPYASQSMDYEVALGYVDTLEVMELWAVAGGAFVTRAPEDLPDDEIHESFARAMAGLTLPAATRLRVSAGADALYYASGGVRVLLLGAIEYSRSRSLAFSLGFHAEAGPAKERVSDGAATASIAVFF